MERLVFEYLNVSFNEMNFGGTTYRAVYKIETTVDRKQKSIPIHDNHDKKNLTPFTTPNVKIVDQ